MPEAEAPILSKIKSLLSQTKDDSLEQSASEEVKEWTQEELEAEADRCIKKMRTVDLTDVA